MKEKEPVISVIVPIFNVEAYLPQCLDSIINQTYTKLEIILVDDGSTDQSASICEEYQKRDCRIKVIRKQNEGVSAARNIGLSQMTGELVGFVDADDYIDKDMYKELYRLMNYYDADVACCTYKREIDNRIQGYESDEIKVFHGTELLESMVTGKDGYIISPAVWNRLYRKEVFDDIQFPSGRIFEDKLVSTQILEKINIGVFTNKAYYTYRQRKGSLTRSGISDQYIEDFIEMFKQESNIVDGILSKEYSLKRMFNYYCILLDTYCNACKSCSKKITKLDTIKSEMKRIKHRIRPAIGKKKKIPRKDKVLLYLSTYSVNLYVYLINNGKKNLYTE